jgi:hypothetical protein
MVGRCSLTLVNKRALGLHSKKAQVSQYSAGTARHFPWWINIFDPDQPFAVSGFRLKIAGHGRDQ